jgi:hypothetical protein
MFKSTTTERESICSRKGVRNTGNASETEDSLTLHRLFRYQLEKHCQIWQAVNVMFAN